MKDKDRLNLLKEVAGTTVYEERRAESIKIMEETASKQGKVDEVLQFIEERLNELNQEKEELVEYEQLDKQRRALEWNLYQKETQRLNLEYDSIETERDNIRKEQQSFYTMIRRLQDEISSLEDNMNNLRMTVDRLNKRKVNKEDDMNQINEKRAMIESQIQDLELTIQSREKSLISYREQLQEIEEQLNESKQQLDVIEPSYQEKKRLLFQQTNQLNQMKARIDSLYGKQGRSQQFTTKAERNKFLTTQINRLKDQFNKKQQSGQQIIQKIEQDTQRIKTEEEILNKLDHEQQNHVKQIEQLNHQIMEQITQRNTFQEEKKLHQREIEKLYEQLHDARQDLEKGKAQLNRSLPQHISQGLAMIETIVAEKKIRGYYGPVIDNINLKNPSFRTAVEVAAGNQLFNVIVDNDATAAILIEELEKLNAGRLTFLPLNRLKLRSVSYPENHPNVKALIDVAIDYEEEVERAIRLVFGMKLIAKDLEIATEAARQFNMDTLTIDGDIVNHRGAIEGGYHDERLSKILAVERIRDSSQKIQQFDEKEKQYQQRLHQMDVKISSVLQALHTLENNKHHLQLLDERHMKEIITKRRLIYNLQSNIQEYQKNRDITENEIETLTKTIQNYEEELDLPLHSNLTEAERNELQTLEDQQKQVSHQVDILKKEVVMLENSREEIETNIQTNLQKRKEELEYLLSDTATTVTTVTTTTVAEEAAAPSSGRKGKRGASAVAPATTTTTTTTTSFRDFPAELASLRTEYESLERVLETTRNDYQEIMNNILSKSSQLNKYEIEVENKREQEKQYHDQLNEINNALGKLYTKKEVLQSSLETRQRAIRDLGSIPQKEQDEFKAYSEKQLTKRLNEVTGQSKKFAHVNRKALDQFLSFHEQRESLLKRKEEMLRDTKAIEELIQSLDMQKDEAINRTFTSVSQHFADVFQELVPNGYGKLIMKTVLEEGGDSEEEVEEEEEGKKGKASSKKKGKKATSSPSISGSNGNGPTEDHVLNEEGSATAGGRVLSLPLDSYRGIQVIVSFNKSTGEQFSMQQLSGGQKALVALALIFSIQRCDPAPFYLFDEIDQALDTNYRKAVANLIYRQANSEESPAQFITTTFRPEFVEVADRCFGIALTNKVSNLYALEKVRRNRVNRTILLMLSNRFFSSFFFAG